MNCFRYIKRCVLFLSTFICAGLVMAQDHGQYKDLIHQNIPEPIENYREIYRDTLEYQSPVIVEVRDSILEPMRVVTNKFGKNWFVFATGGVHTFLGDYSNLGPFRGTITPDFSIGVGKWFTPGIGLKVEYILPTNSRGYTAYKEGHWGYGDLVYNKDGQFLYRKFKTGWWDLSASVILNLTRLFLGYEGMDNTKRMNQIMFTAGIGMVHHTGFHDGYGSQNEISAHTELQYSRFFTKSKRWSLDFKVRGLFYQSNFDMEYGMEDHVAHKIDMNIGVYVGFTLYLGRKRSNGWGNSVTELYQRDFRQRDVLVVRENTVKADKVKQGTMTFFVFYPNNYSGRNDAPVIQDAEVNTMDYLAGGLFTQKRYKDTGNATGRLMAGNTTIGLATEDLPTELAEELTYADYLPRGYELGSTPMSLSMRPEDMMEFREKEGFYYAPIYDGQHVWGYRIDDATLGQSLLSNENYSETKSYGINAHRGLDILKENMIYDQGDELVSFADVYAAINGNEGYISQFTDPETVDRIKEIFNNGVISGIQVEGMATSQDNNASNAVGIERNTALAENRAESVLKWLQQNENLGDALSQTFISNGKNTINPVPNKSTRELDAKLNRGVKVRINYLKR